ncbi:hypothetical protein BZG36_00107 [Bifiguratus adelaidae]|uniref:Galactose oxidase n=1 Tax=Bifiguratus adelaidae TaxID=1938954 RepID=A0A261Y865_9FUNG|nr:hypothetical protein BZG36_00107 [Bifiguratus adelaidae]
MLSSMLALVLIGTAGRIVQAIPVWNQCSFVYNDTFYLLGPNQPASMNTNFSFTKAPINLNGQTTWTSLDANSNMLVDPRPCVVTTNGTLLTGVDEHGTMQGFDLVSQSSMGQIQTCNGRQHSLFTADDQLMIQVFDVLYIFGPANATLSNVFYTLNLTSLNCMAHTLDRTSEPTPSWKNMGLTFANGVIYAFGGSQGANGNLTYSASIYTFNITQRSWSLLNSSKLDMPLDSIHVVNYNNQKVFLFPGGTTGEKTPKGMRVFDLSTSSIIIADSQNEPPGDGVFGSSFGYMGDALLIFGGVHGSSLTISNTLAIFNMTTSSWASVANAPTVFANNGPVFFGGNFTVNPNVNLRGDQAKPAVPVIVGSVIGGIFVMAACVGFIYLSKRRWPDMQDTDDKTGPARTPYNRRIAYLQRKGSMLEPLNFVASSQTDSSPVPPSVESSPAQIRCPDKLRQLGNESHHTLASLEAPIAAYFPATAIPRTSATRPNFSRNGTLATDVQDVAFVSSHHGFTASSNIPLFVVNADKFSPASEISMPKFT